MVSGAMKAVRPNFLTIVARGAALFGLVGLIALVALFVRNVPDLRQPSKAPEQSNAAMKADRAAFAPDAAPLRSNTSLKTDRFGGKPSKPPLGQFSPVAPPFDIVSADTFKADTRQFKLAGVEGPPRNAVCIGADGGLWACGLYARAALNNALKDRKVECAPQLAEAGQELQVACTINGGNLAGILVGLGWLRPVEGEEAFTRERDEAKSQRRGMWNGDWQIRS